MTATRRTSNTRLSIARLLQMAHVAAISAVCFAIAIGITACGANAKAHAEGNAAKTYLIVDGGTGLARKPTDFCASADGSGCLTHVHWTNWGGTRTTGQGTYTRETCKPDCASGTTLSYRATLRATEIRTCQGEPTYTDLDVWTKHPLSDGAIETTILLPGTPEKCPPRLAKAKKDQPGANQTSSTTTATRSETVREKELEGGECTSNLYGHDVEVTIFGAGTKGCTEWDRIVSRAGGYWRQVEVQGGSQSFERLICSMRRQRLIVEVRDTGGASYGSEICARLTAEGWTEASGPGALTEQERQEDEQREGETEQRKEQEDSYKEHE